MPNLNKIAIVGYGVVGQAVHAWFKQAKILSRGVGSWDDVADCDVFFVCVPSPYKEGAEYDLSALEEVCAKIPDGKIVVLKSTVNIGTTDYFQDKYPNKKFFFNPEFLTNITATQDFLKPDMQVLGVPWQSYDYAFELMRMLPPAPIMRIVSPRDAEAIKKVRNAFYALKVIFFNQISDYLEKAGAHYETVREAVTKDPRIGDSHSVIWHWGYRGFGDLVKSKCLPKDLFALLDHAKKLGKDLPLLQVTKELNEKYLAIKQ